MAFVKLDCDMLNSTIWIDRDARDVFITALLMAVPYEVVEPLEQLYVDSLEATGWLVPPGWYGFVKAAGPSIVARSGTPRELGLGALRHMSEPEMESKSQEYDGRRVARVNGGYIVLNYFKYRDRDDTAAERMRRLRLRKKEQQQGNQQSYPVTPNTQAVHRNVDGVTPNTPSERRHVTHAESRGQSAEVRSSLRSHGEPASRDSQREFPTSPVSKERGREIKREESSAKPADEPKSRTSRFAAGALGDIPVKPKDHVVPRVQAGNGHGFRHAPAREAASASQSPEAPEPGAAASESPAEEPDPATEPQTTDLTDLPVEKPAETRRAGLDVLVAGVRADNRARLTQDQKKQRAKERGIANLASDGSAPPKGSKLSKAKYMQLMGRLEGIWLKEVRVKFPGVTFTQWAGKERSQTNELVEKYGEEITGLSFLYVVRNWEALSTRMFKGKGGVPSIGMILKLHDSLVVEAQQWTKIRQVQEEVSRWKASNPAQQGYFGVTLPQELVEMRRAVEPLAKTLGIVL